MSPDTLAVATIRTFAELELLRAEWLALWRRVPEATPFQSPAWLIPWLQVFGQGELIAFALRRDDRLVGFVPLYVLREGGKRKLLPVGVGISDYLDPLLEPTSKAAAIATVLRELAGEAHRFDRCDLEQQREASAWLMATAASEWSLLVHACTPAPVLTLTDLGISAHRRNRLRYYWRRAQAMGDARIRIATADELWARLKDLYRLHAARWRGRGEPGVLSDGKVRAFHDLAAPALHAQGCLRLYVFEVGDRVAAVFYTMTDHVRCHVYLCGFDPELAQLSPGKLVIAAIVDDSLGSGLSELHFLRGQEAYKYDWGAEDQPLLGLRLLWARDDASLSGLVPVKSAAIP